MQLSEKNPLRPDDDELLAREGIYYRLWNGLVSGQTL